MKLTMYELMKALKRLGAWRLCLAFVPKFETLILYYRVYELAERKEPNRGYGYLVRLLEDEEVRCLLPKDRFQSVTWDTNRIRMAIREMERVYWV